MTTADLFEEAGAALLAETGCTVRKWRTKTTGVAYTNADDWGIEAPRPRGALSFATFAHEVAHQVLHRRNSKPRWLEEIEAWEWALAQFDRFDLPGVLVAQEDAAECGLTVEACRSKTRGGSSAATPTGCGPTPSG
jgi:hypothetical protein